MKKIESIKALRKEINDGNHEFFLLLNGNIRSSKHILLSAFDKFKILNEIDGSIQVLSEKQLYTKSNIGEAIDKGAFYKYLKHERV